MGFNNLPENIIVSILFWDGTILTLYPFVRSTRTFSLVVQDTRPLYKVGRWRRQESWNHSGPQAVDPSGTHPPPCSWNFSMGSRRRRVNRNRPYASRYVYGLNWCLSENRSKFCNSRTAAAAAANNGRRRNGTSFSYIYTAAIHSNGRNWCRAFGSGAALLHSWNTERWINWTIT